MAHNNKSRKIYLGLLICLLPVQLWAEENDITPSSSIYFSAGLDTLENTNLQVQINLELSGFQQISAGYAETTSTNTQSNSSQRFVGLATSPYETFSMGTEFSIWGKEQVLETRSLRSDIFINLDSWSLSASPELNVVTIFYGTNNSKSRDIYAKGLSLSANYYGFENYFAGFNVYQNKFADYPFLDNEKIRDAVFSRISTGTQLLMSGLEENHSRFSIGRFFNWGSLEFNWMKSKTSFIDSNTYIKSLLIDIQVNKTISLSIISSQQTSSDDSDTIYSIDIGSSIYW